MTDQNDDLDLEGLDPEDELESDDPVEEPDDAPPPPEDDPEQKRTSKRINDLMSMAQKAEARARKAEAKLLEAVRSGGRTSTPPQEPAQGAIPAEVQAWLAQARDVEIDRVFAADPRFEEYGIDRAVLTGDTPQEIRAVAEQVKTLIDHMESTVRNKVLRQHGFAPDLGGAVRPPRKDYGSMSAEEFEREVARAKRGL